MSLESVAVRPGRARLISVSLTLRPRARFLAYARTVPPDASFSSPFTLLCISTRRTAHCKIPRIGSGIDLFAYHLPLSPDACLASLAPWEVPIFNPTPTVVVCSLVSLYNDEAYSYFPSTACLNAIDHRAADF